MRHIPAFVSAEYICMTLQTNGFEIISLNKFKVQSPHLEGGFKY